MRPETLALHAGFDHDEATRAVAVPIHTSVAFEFDSAENALAFAQGPFAEETRRAGALASARLFDGDIVKEASIDLDSPYYN